MTPKLRDLKDIERDCEATTPGPWVNRPHGIIQTQNESVTVPKEGIIFWDDTSKVNNSKGTENYQFIAHAREDVPALVACVRELSEKLDWFVRSQGSSSTEDLLKKWGLK